MKKFHVLGFANGIVTVFMGDDDRPVGDLTGRFGLVRWLRIWWRLK
jgi:hypothetical protein